MEPADAMRKTSREGRGAGGREGRCRSRKQLLARLCASRRSRKLRGRAGDVELGNALRTDLQSQLPRLRRQSSSRVERRRRFSFY